MTDGVVLDDLLDKFSHLYRARSFKQVFSEICQLKRIAGKECVEANSSVDLKTVKIHGKSAFSASFVFSKAQGVQ